MRCPGHDWATHGLTGSKAATQGVRLRAVRQDTHAVSSAYMRMYRPSTPMPTKGSSKAMHRRWARSTTASLLSVRILPMSIDSRKSARSVLSALAPVQPAIRARIDVAAEVRILRVTVQQQRAALEGRNQDFPGFLNWWLRAQYFKTI